MNVFTIASLIRVRVDMIPALSLQIRLDFEFCFLFRCFPTKVTSGCFVDKLLLPSCDKMHGKHIMENQRA